MLQPERLKKVFFFQSDLTFITDITGWWFQLFLNGGALGETGMFYIIWLLVSNIFYFHPENWRATGSTNGAANREKQNENWGRFPFWLVFFKLGWNHQPDYIEGAISQS